MALARSIVTRLRALPPYRFDALLGLLVYVEVCAELVLLAELRGAKLALGLALASMFAVGVALRRRLPLPAIAWATGGLAVGGLLGTAVTDNVTSPLFLTMFVTYTAGTVLEGRRLAAGAAVGAVLVVGVVLTDSEDGGPIDAVFPFIFVVAGPMLVGLFLRNRARLNQALRDKARRAEEDRAAQADIAALDERTRIASELHDVVAHALSAMTVQATAARRLAASEPAKAAAGFAAVEGTGREALTELRRLLGVLRKEDEELGLAPQPSLAHVAGLARRATASGLPVDLTVAGAARPLPAGVDLTAYRVVQEALGRAREAGRAGRAAVTVTYGDADVAVEVRDDGGTAGRGLLGTQERVAVYGGELASAPVDGGWQVRARLPAEAAP